jgi:hypothetical protein
MPAEHRDDRPGSLGAVLDQHGRCAAANRMGQALNGTLTNRSPKGEVID